MSPRRLLLLDLQSGISGDMFVAAAAALAGCSAQIVELPDRLNLPQVTCRFHDVIRGGLLCRKFEVADHDQAPAGDASPLADLPTLLDPVAAHSHHAHRSLRDIVDLIERSRLAPAIQARAIRMFERLGQIEAEAHGISVGHVHFHEVGAIDSILDIVAAAVCIERLLPFRAVASPVCLGHGSTRTAHGSLPVPAPATERLLHGVPFFAGELRGEWTTPTGALILAELQPTFTDPLVAVTSSALGAGDKDPPGRPNALRLRLGVEAPPGDATHASLTDEVAVLRCNLDDTTGQLLGADFLGDLLGAGAVDALLIPVIMKKGRPGLQLEVLAPVERAHALAEHILTHSTTLGVRISREIRTKAPREPAQIQTPFGPVAGKKVRLPDGSSRTSPEYEACRALALATGIPVQTIYRAALDRA